MYLIYVDESGYCPSWAEEKAISEQPVHVVSAVAIPSENVDSVYRRIRDCISRLKLPEIDANALGKGQEIKANAVDRGDGFWARNPELRAKVREIYMDQSSVTYFVVCVDKARHFDKYIYPEDPADLGLQFLLERAQGFLQEQAEQGLVFLDENKPLEEQQRELMSRLLLEGSGGIAVRRINNGITYEWRLKMENIMEIHFGDSRYSLGIQIADFVARHTYSWWKSDKKEDYPGWSFILPRLWKYPNHDGYGYREFPKE